MVNLPNLESDVSASLGADLSIQENVKIASRHLTDLAQQLIWKSQDEVLKKWVLDDLLVYDVDIEGSSLEVTGKVYWLSGGKHLHDKGELDSFVMQWSGSGQQLQYLINIEDDFARSKYFIVMGKRTNYFAELEKRNI